MEKIEATFYAIKNDLKNGDLFNSFVALIEYLNKNKMTYTIIFRTFGHDLDKIISEVKQKTNLNFKPRARFHGNELHIDETILKTPKEILQSIKPFEHCGWQDDWNHWDKQGKIYEAAKLYPIDFENEDIISIFFDDNAIDKQIIGVKSISEQKLFQYEVQKELRKQGRIVAVNTFEASSVSNYFIDKVNFAFEKSLVFNEKKDKIFFNKRSANVALLFDAQVSTFNPNILLDSVQNKSFNPKN